MYPGIEKEKEIYTSAEGCGLLWHSLCPYALITCNVGSTRRRERSSRGRQAVPLRNMKSFETITTLFLLDASFALEQQRESRRRGGAWTHLEKVALRGRAFQLPAVRRIEVHSKRQVCGSRGRCLTLFCTETRCSSRITDSQQPESNRLHIRVAYQQMLESVTYSCVFSWCLSVSCRENSGRWAAVVL